MCSRQERIQKDIDIVIQKSRAEKDCLFAGEFLSPGSWDPEPAFPPATPLPRFLTATRAAWVGGECGAASPRSRCIWKQLQRRELELQGGGGHEPPLPRPPSSDRPGQPRAPGSAEPARSECRGRALDSSHRRCPEHPPGSGGRSRAGRFAPSAERRRPGGDRLRRAALLRSAPPRPREKAALGRAPAPLVAPAPRRAHTHRAGDRMDSRGSRAMQAQPGGPFASIFAPPRPRAVRASARSLAGAASGRLAGKFPPLPWHPALVAGGRLPLHPTGCSASPPAP